MSRIAAALAPAPLRESLAHAADIGIPGHGDSCDRRRRRFLCLVRLVELDPGWFVTDEGRRGMGITFLCPCCRIQHLRIWFANPIDGGPPAAPGVFPLPRWKRSGDTFDTLTIEPSIDCSKFGHWHGHITAGEIRPA
jgi:hypothetical protein